MPDTSKNIGRSQELDEGVVEDREKHMRKQLFIADHILYKAIEEHEPSHVFGMFSGGHDSLCATAVAARHPKFSGAVHINTGVGIEATRDFVRETCEREGWPLIEMHPDDKTYEELVLEKGFPHGPASHNSMYYYLKQRAIRRVVKENKTHYYDRIALVTGIRQLESNRRLGKGISVEVRRNGAQLWVNPILYWSKLDCNAYIRQAGLERNEVVDTIHKSGECLCGAFAKSEELDEIASWYPQAGEQIKELERKAREKGLIDCHWAQSRAPGKTWDDLEEDELDEMELCTDCVVNIDEEVA